MRISYNWLKEYMDLPVDAETLGKKYTSAGLELDEVVTRGEGLDNVVVARVLTCDAVEGSDHLHKCTVDAGCGEPLLIFCGAPNVHENMLVACAKVGAVLPGGFAISERKMFGAISCGMLCSQKELDLSDDHAGIWDLDPIFAGEDAPIGTPIAEALNLKDDVLIIELTPNRSDCLGMLNCAREAGAVLSAEVRMPDLSYEELGKDAKDSISIRVEDFDLCPRYVGRIVRNVKIGPSPLWMQNYLLAAGMRPINNVVDISNFVMLEYNQPLHTFDLSCIKDNTIVVRASKKEETMTTLDEKERTFCGEEILITDGKDGDRPVCVAGVMGGMETEVTDATTDILIEAACFNATSIRKTARRLGIPSEASMRFEKGVNAAGCDDAAQRACQLLVKYCGGVAEKGAVDVRAPKYADGFPETVVTLRPERVNHILGTAFSTEEILSVMTRLGFGVEEKGDAYAVTVPAYRQDISIEVDLVEEVARLIGYEHIPQTLPAGTAQGGRSVAQELTLKLKNLAAGYGYFENVNYSFINAKECDKLQLPADHDWRRMLPISNPLSEEQSVMRRSLLPGLLNAACRNLSRRNLDLRLFEVGTVFVPDMENPTTVQPKEIPTFAMLLAGDAAPFWQGAPQPYDFFALKGAVEQILAQLGCGKVSFVRTQTPYFHPGRAAEILVDGARVGEIGEIHPTVAENYDLTGRVIAAEFSLELLIAAAAEAAGRRHDLPRYPASTRDIAIIGSASVPAADIEAAIREAGGCYLENVALFDLYDKAPILPGRRSLAYALTFRSEEGTLRDTDVDQAFKNIVETLAERFDYQLR